MKDYVEKTKEMLEARCDQFMSFEDKITILNDEIAKGKTVHEDYRKKIIIELQKIAQEHSVTKSDLTRHLAEYKSTF